MQTQEASLPRPDRAVQEESKGQGTALRPVTGQERLAKEEETAAVLSFFLG